MRSLRSLPISRRLLLILAVAIAMLGALGASDPVPKVSYVQLFEPRGWVLGSGVYVDDMQAQFHRQALRALLIGLGIGGLMSLLVILIARSIVVPLNEAVSAMANIASGEADLTRSLNAQGNDE